MHSRKHTGCPLVPIFAGFGWTVDLLNQLRQTERSSFLGGYS